MLWRLGWCSIVPQPLFIEGQIPGAVPDYLAGKLLVLFLVVIGVTPRSLPRH
jgi:hypothetical protein